MEFNAILTVTVFLPLVGALAIAALIRGDRNIRVFAALIALADLALAIGVMVLFDHGEGAKRFQMTDQFAWIGEGSVFDNGTLDATYHLAGPGGTLGNGAAKGDALGGKVPTVPEMAAQGEGGEKQGRHRRSLDPEGRSRRPRRADVVGLAVGAGQPAADQAVPRLLNVGAAEKRHPPVGLQGQRPRLQAAKRRQAFPVERDRSGGGVDPSLLPFRG